VADHNQRFSLLNFRQHIRGVISEFGEADGLHLAVSNLHITVQNIDHNVKGAIFCSSGQRRVSPDGGPAAGEPYGKGDLSDDRTPRQEQRPCYRSLHKKSGLLSSLASAALEFMNGDGDQADVIGGRAAGGKSLCGFQDAVNHGPHGFQDGRSSSLIERLANPVRIPPKVQNSPDDSRFVLNRVVHGIGKAL